MLFRSRRGKGGGGSGGGGELKENLGGGLNLILFAPHAQSNNAKRPQIKFRLDIRPPP